MILGALTLTFLSTTLSGCASVEIPDLAPEITLPASGDCYSRTTLTRIKTRIPKEECAKRSKRAIKLYSEDWHKLRFILLKNCLQFKCKQTVGALDEFFQYLDDAAGAVNKTL